MEYSGFSIYKILIALIVSARIGFNNVKKNQKIPFLFWWVIKWIYQISKYLNKIYKNFVIQINANIMRSQQKPEQISKICFKIYLYK